MSDIAPLSGRPAIVYTDTGVPVSSTDFLSSLATMGVFSKQEIEDLASLLPTPYVMPADMQVTFQRIGEMMGLMQINDALRTGDLSSSQQTIIKNLLDAWSQNEKEKAEALEEETQYAWLHPSSDQLSQALAIAESKVIISLLDKMIDDNAKLAEAWRAEQKAEEINPPPSMQLLQNYLYAIQNGKASLSQPALSFVLTGVSGSGDVRVGLVIDPSSGTASIDPKQDSVLPLGQNVIFNLVVGSSALVPLANDETMNAIALSLAQVMQNVQVTCAYWAIPFGLSLVSQDTQEPAKALTESSVRSYALTLEKFVMADSFRNFVAVVLARSGVGGGPLTNDQIDRYVAYLRIMLLSNALAAVDKMMTGGVIFRGADFRDYLEGKIPVAKDDVRYSLFMNIRTLLGQMPEGDREAMITQLVSYYDSNPQVSALIDPTKAFLALIHPRFAETVTSQQPH